MRSWHLYLKFAGFRRWQMLRLPPCFAIHVEAVHPHINELFIIIVDVNAKSKVILYHRLVFGT